jgi:hypothetical protein
MDRLDTLPAASNAARVAAGGAPAPAPAAKIAGVAGTPAFAAEFEKAKEKLDKDEALASVDGHSFARIKGGERHDMCLNLSGNERSGKAFDLITREGRTFHVYGDGKDKVVVEVKPKAADDAPAPAAAKPNATAPATTGGTVAPKR